ncbi:MAG: AAA family ATPase, partial [Myxococcales bacterium]|nr:AAA family ATPase [Myxococcales bacterium]
HGRGVVHRDLKPDNIILMPKRGPVIVDFGISIQSLGASAREALESGGRAMGSPGYMAPEQIRGDIVDARADLYAIGCMLFEIVAGRLPFEAHELKLLFSKKLHADAPATRAFVPSLSAALDSLIARMLARRPEDRPGHADDVAAALAALGAEDHGQPGPPAEPYLYRPGLAGRDAALQTVAGALARAAVGIEPAAKSRGSGDGPPVPSVPAPVLAPHAAIDVPSEELRTELDATLNVVRGTAVGSSRGGFVFVGGVSGVGKTRLAVEVATHAQRRGFSVVTCQCVRVDTEGDDAAVRASPLHPFSDFFLAVADRCRSLGEPGYDALLGAGGALLSTFAPVLSELPGFKRGTRTDELPPDAARDQVHEALRHTLRAFAAREPLLLVIDDLQWADEHTRHFLRTLDDAWFDRNPIVILPTYRADEETKELAELREKRAHTTVMLERLQEDAMIRIVRDMLAVDTPDPRLITFLQLHSEGNPFFIAEFLRAAIAKRLLRRDESGSWRYEAEDGDDIGALPLPAALRDIIAFRLAGLSAEAREIAETVAVLGRETAGAVLEG